jgi:hypothetical protein
MEHQPTNEPRDKRPDHTHGQDKWPPLETETQDTGQIEHGDAFRAYLTLPDIDPHRADLVQAFSDVYIGTFSSMNVLLDELTEIGECQAAIDEVAKSWGFDGLVNLDQAAVARIAHETWDIVEVGGQLHVFIE